MSQSLWEILQIQSNLLCLFLSYINKENIA